MDDDELGIIETEYHSDDIGVISKNPLIGVVDLWSEEHGAVALKLDRVAAEELLSALIQFLGQGEGQDAPNIATVQ
ncbi:hypothetical protein [Rhizobium sp. YTU87027]|uniref:hypothetical protein n=1 Tax=Rhizobium sp. YTU87027 TaxID=3417741 RepID=UPI003D699809